jgi:hypothetical protein
MSAQQLIRESNFGEALKILQNACQEYGGNITLLCDTAVCEYYLGLIPSYRRTLARARHVLESHKELISRDRMLACKLMISKLLEEDGDVAEAFNICN